MNNIIFKSLEKNIESFIKDVDIHECYKLYFYLSTVEHLHQEPTEFQQKFITEFFGDINWVNHVNYHKKDNKFTFAPKSLFSITDTINILSFLIIKKSRKKLLQSEINEIKTERDLNLMKMRENYIHLELIIAIHRSTYDGIFDKIDGFSNILDVLTKYNLINLEDIKDD